MRTAIVHDWLVVCGGGERVLQEMIRCYPEADLFAVNDFLPDSERAFLQGKSVRTTFIQKLPLARKHYRHYLPLMPLAIEQLDLRGYDLVLSSSHAVAKGVITGPGQCHVSYIHSPMRYAWDLQAQYLEESGLNRSVKGALARWMLHRLRAWDQASAARPDALMANSHYIAERIRKSWRRTATVVHPPVDIEHFTPGAAARENFYVTASRFVPYKKIDLIVKSFAEMPDKTLVVIGDGPDAKKIRKAAGRNVELTGYLPAAQMTELFRRAKGFIFAAEEDFGIVPLEAQACGTPVIAYGRGGSLETVRGLDHAAPTGLFFPQQSVPAICAAVRQFEDNAHRFTPDAFAAQVARFSPAVFRQGLLGVVCAAQSSV